MNITISQIKAGRALLGWTQEDLAVAAHLSKPALANIERGHVIPRPATLKAIENALQASGLEFTNGPGVRLVQDRLDVEVFYGADSICRLWEDIYQTLKPGEERLISCVDERKFIKNTQHKFKEMMEKYEKAGISGRILNLKGDRNFADPTSEYRWVGKEKFLDISYYVYADKYAMLIWEPVPRVLVIQNAVVAQTYQQQFNRHWDLAEIPSR
jgi:transcriptional regulator with XRE-family HTH domain